MLMVFWCNFFILFVDMVVILMWLGVSIIVIRYYSSIFYFIYDIGWRIGCVNIMVFLGGIWVWVDVLMGIWVVLDWELLLLSKL